MSTKEKLLKRLLDRPKDFTYEEARSVLKGLGYVESQKGKTSGSKIAFYNEEKQAILIHRPHPQNILKKYAINAIISALRENGDIV